MQPDESQVNISFLTLLWLSNCVFLFVSLSVCCVQLFPTVPSLFPLPSFFFRMKVKTCLPFIFKKRNILLCYLCECCKHSVSLCQLWLIIAVTLWGSGLIQTSVMNLHTADVFISSHKVRYRALHVSALNYCTLYHTDYVVCQVWNVISHISAFILTSIRTAI